MRMESMTDMQDLEVKQEHSYFDDLVTFFNQVIDNFQIVDPLDRAEYFGREEEELQDAWKVSELRENINNLLAIDGYKLNTPLTNEAYSQLERCINEDL